MHSDTYWPRLFEKAIEDGLSKGARANGVGVVADSDFWFCPYSNADVREENLDAHLTMERHLDNKVWYRTVASLAVPMP